MEVNYCLYFTRLFILLFACAIMYITINECKMLKSKDNFLICLVIFVLSIFPMILDIIMKDE